jgi:hypothetical protein
LTIGNLRLTIEKSTIRNRQSKISAVDNSYLLYFSGKSKI